MKKISKNAYLPSASIAANGADKASCFQLQRYNKRGAWRTSTIVLTSLGVFLSVSLLVGTVGLGFYYVKFVRPVDTTTESTENAEATDNIAISPTGDDGEGKNFSVTDAATLPDQDGKKALSTIEIADKVGPATVSVMAEVPYTSTFGTDETGISSGSGFIISQDGYIVTNTHVVSGATTAKVLLPGEDDPIDAVIVGTDPSTDIAVLKIDRTNLEFVVLGNSDALQVGELAVAIGNPFGELAGSVTVGVVSALHRELTIENISYVLIQTDASINSGNSGGPLVNSYGEVIGVTSAKMSSGEGIGFAIPINDVKVVIEDLINSGYVTGRPVIGVGVMTVDQESADQYGWPNGVYVKEIADGGPADLAGIMIGDIITQIDGTPISTSEELVQIKNDREIGDTLLITVYRNGETKEISLILKEEKPT